MQLHDKYVDGLTVPGCYLTDEKVALIGFHQMDVNRIDLSGSDASIAIVWATIGIALYTSTSTS